MTIATCHGCGIAEHIHLLDAKPGTPERRVPRRPDFERLECIACYGPGWAPCGGANHLTLSVAPSLRSLYQNWMRRAA